MRSSKRWACYIRSESLETAISEIIATEDETHRKALLDVLKCLLAYGNCIMPFNWIIEEQAKAYQHDSAGYNWRPAPHFLELLLNLLEQRKRLGLFVLNPEFSATAGEHRGRGLAEKCNDPRRGTNGQSNRFGSQPPHPHVAALIVIAPLRLRRDRPPSCRSRSRSALGRLSLHSMRRL